MDAQHLGVEENSLCSNCGNSEGRKLKKESLEKLAHRFFVWGSIHRCQFGAVPVVQFDKHQTTSITVSEWLKSDIKIFEKLLGVGFFLYGPRLWMVGEVEPLQSLQDEKSQNDIINRILREYPTRVLGSSQQLYRIRKSPRSPELETEYDSAPKELGGTGRFDSVGFPVLYTSEDLDTCLLECRVSAEDEIFVATLQPEKKLKMLDLAVLLKEENVTEFDSLDIAIHMLFLAGSHAYPIIRSISKAALKSGFDGVIYPSYYSLYRLGIMPFQTTYGLSHRIIPQYQEYEQHTAIPNAAIFGHPIAENKLKIKCINRLVIRQVAYNVIFGPIKY